MRSPDTHQIFAWVAFSEPQRSSTWLENALSRPPNHRKHLTIHRRAMPIIISSEAGMEGLANRVFHDVRL
jgi:hypothetical protein